MTAVTGVSAATLGIVFIRILHWCLAVTAVDIRAGHDIIKSIKTGRNIDHAKSQQHEKRR